MIVELFGGPGGWAVGLDLATGGQHQPAVAIEWDDAACRTRAAAGYPTIRADVAQYPRHVFAPPARHGRRVTGVIASPPCPAFSSAGKGHGRDLVPRIVEHVHKREWDARPDPDPEVWLVIALGHWLTELEPEWIALEQVPAVLPIWRAYCHVLDQLGYSTWCGILNAADYGVPQTRERAILVASMRRNVAAPAATHDEHPTPSLFGDGDARR